MVRTWPMRPASRAETSCEKAPSTLTAKKMAPAVATGTANLRNSQRATIDCTTNPPPNASSEKSAESCSTTRRDLASGGARGAGGGSTAGERRR